MTRRAKRAINDGELRRLWLSRLTEAEIAKRMGHHPWTLRRRAKKIGLPPSRRQMWKDNEA